MDRITANVSKWNLYLHRSARGMPQPERRDTTWDRFEDELFERFYTGGLEELPERRQDRRLAPWSKQVMTAAEQVPDFGRLVEECRGAPDLAAAAVEQIAGKLRHLAPKDIDSPEGPAPSLGTLSADDAELMRKLRRILRGAVKEAQGEVDEQREAAEALSGVAGMAGMAGMSGWLWGNGAGAGGAYTGAGHQSLAKRLKNDPRLKRIALLAGRMKRIAAQKQKTKVLVGSDELCDVEQGANIARLLPTELMLIRHPKLKTLLHKKLLERQAMQYQLSGVEEKGKGPIVVCIDKSGSMNGPPDIWATAVALALLDIAIRQKRAFALVSFDSYIRDKRFVPVGGTLPQDALFVYPSGGTDITLAMSEGLDIIASNQGTMKKADLVLIGDGGSDPVDAPLMRERAKALGVVCLGIGIGIEADVMRPWCDEVVAYNGDLDTVEGAAAEALFAGI